MMTNPAQADEISAIAIFKQQDKVKALIAAHPVANNDISFSELEMGGQCGVVGCTWQKLVAMVITSKRVNAPSLTILAVVSGNTPSRGAAPTVRFVDLTEMDEAKWQVKL